MFVVLDSFAKPLDAIQVTTASEVGLNSSTEIKLVYLASDEASSSFIFQLTKTKKIIVEVVLLC